MMQDRGAPLACYAFLHVNSGASWRPLFRLTAAGQPCNGNIALWVIKGMLQSVYLTDLQEQRFWVKVVFLGILHLQAYSLRTNLPARHHSGFSLMLYRARRTSGVLQCKYTCPKLELCKEHAAQESALSCLLSHH